MNGAPLIRLASCLLLGIVLFVTGRLGLLLDTHASSWSLWPPAGIAGGALTLGGLALWPGVAMGTVALAATTAIGPRQALLWTALAVGEALVLALLARRWLGAGRTAKFAGLAPLLTVIAPVVSAAFALAGTVGGSALGTVAAGGAFGYWLRTWTADLTGVIVFLPAVIAIARPSPAQRLSFPRFVENGVLLALVIGSVRQAGRFDAHAGLLLATPWIGLIGFRLRERAVTLAILIAITLTVLRRFAGEGPADASTLTLLTHAAAIATLAITGYWTGFCRTPPSAMRPEDVREAARSVAEGAPITLFGLREQPGQEPLVTYVSSGLRHLFPREPTADAGSRHRPLLDLIARVRPADRDAAVAMVDQELDDPTAARERWVRVIANVVRRDDHGHDWRGAVFDVTAAHADRQRDHAALARAQACERHSGQVSFVWSRSDRQFSTDRARFESITGIVAEPWLRPVATAVHHLSASDGDRLRQAISQLARQRQAMDLRLEVIGSDRRRRWLQVHAEAQWSATGRLGAIFGYLRDASADVRRDASVARLGERIRGSRAQRALGRVAAAVSRDLRGQLQDMLARADEILRLLEQHPDSSLADAISGQLIEQHADARRALRLTARLHQWALRSRATAPSHPMPTDARPTSDTEAPPAPSAAPAAAGAARIPPLDRSADPSVIRARDPACKARALVLAADTTDRQSIAELLRCNGYEAHVTADLRAALARIDDARAPVAVVVATGAEGRALRGHLARWPDPIAMVLIDRLDAQLAPVALVEGVITVAHPPHPALLGIAVERALLQQVANT